MSKKLRAQKVEGYLLEPLREGYSAKWESHHATNPCVVRFSKDPRVFLGYRAGGDDDLYSLDGINIWGSHLGLAILDESGQKVENRLPLPIMKKLTDIQLPTTKEEYQAYMKVHADDIVVLHDFRFFEYKDFLHVIFHEATLNECYDCIVRMPVDDFLYKIEKSIELSNKPVEEILDQWSKLWWEETVWQPCGYNGTNRIFSSFVVKGDIIFFELQDGTLQMCHRPLAEGMAVLNTGTDTFAKPTSDGITTYGCFETCVRPGYLDNSHVGNNGLPTRAKIGETEVYIDVTHGCHNRMISQDDFDKHQIHYYPYFRVKDYNTGELLYYSEEPILEFCDVWREYTLEGEWVTAIELLAGVMFSGGQIPVDKDKCGLEDEFITYMGLGDTAVGIAKFTIKDLLPERVIEDIKTRPFYRNLSVDGIGKNEYKLEEKVNGWDWTVCNDPQKRNINVIRQLEVNGEIETGTRVINTIPGSFDADAIIFDSKSVKYIKDIGWVLIYKGIRWDEVDYNKTTQIGWGVLLLDRNNPEKIMYRSTDSFTDLVEREGWTLAEDITCEPQTLLHAEELIPDSIMERVERIHELEDRGLAFASQMRCWQQQKSGMLPKDYKVYLPKNEDCEKDCA